MLTIFFAINVAVQSQYPAISIRKKCSLVHEIAYLYQNICLGIFVAIDILFEAAYHLRASSDYNTWQA